MPYPHKPDKNILKRIKNSFVFKCAAWLIASLFDISEPQTRKIGFYRIHPKTARKLHNEYILKKLEEEGYLDLDSRHHWKKEQLSQYQPKACDDIELGEIRGGSHRSIETVIVSLCFISIVLCYPTAVYLALSK